MSKFSFKKYHQSVCSKLRPGSNRKVFGLLSVIILFAAFLALPVQTEASSGAAAADSGYVIENFHVDINLTDANVYEVHQTIEVNFLESSRGIYVHIPLKSEVELKGADLAKYKAKIKNIRVPGYETEIYTENDNRVIRIGNPDVWIDGRHKYEVSYTYTVGPDHSDEADFLYYNIIGPFWTTDMQDVTFSLTMPHDFEAEGLNFTAGYFGSEDNQRASYQIDGRTISGNVPGGLRAYEALTVYLELPNGYFTKARYNPLMDIIAIIVSVLALAAVVYLYIRYGRDRLQPETVEFYPPGGIDPAHAGYLADGAPDSKDLISLIMYWADQGFLEIIEQDKKISLRKLAELPGDRPVYQQTIFSGLFKTGEYIPLDSLKDSFYQTMSKGKSQLQGAWQDKIYERPSRMAQGGSVLLCLLPLAVAFARAVFVGLYDYESLYIAVTVLTGIITVFFTIALINNRMKWRIRVAFLRVLLVIVSVIFLLFIHLVLIMMTSDAVLDPYGSAVFASLSTLISIPFVVIMSRRTLDGERMYARLMGFRSFMQRAEKARIEMLVHDNPSYFYDILPYAYVLGVTDKWAKQFDGIAIQPPNWYYTDTMATFSVLHFANRMDRAASTMNNVMISTPSNSGGGGSFGGGGGGFSGGGFGGGGGGRW